MNGDTGAVRCALRIAVLMTVIGAAGMLVVISGVIPIKATDKHWALTRWFLHFAKQRSVATHSITIATPSLDETGMVLKGARYYDIGCRPCHGSPEMPHPRIAQGMTPTPPYLPETVSHWDTEDLFYMVKHGIKFTGMPAWPSQQRDDEVWAMVAFLYLFPHLDGAEYREIIDGESVSGDHLVTLAGLHPSERRFAGIVASCARCHGVDGLGRTSAFPRLSGQQRQYLAGSLDAYANGSRHSGIMGPIAAALSTDERKVICDVYARNTPVTESRPSSPDMAGSDTPALLETSSSMRHGAEIAQNGIPERDVPACASCHEIHDRPRSSAFPLLAGQFPEFIELQLRLFQQDRRGGTAYSHIMGQVAKGLDAEQIRDVAHYYGSLSIPPP